MKSALLALILTASSSAYALQVGDSATYNQVTLGKTDVVTTQVNSINGDIYSSETLVDGSSLALHRGSVNLYDQNLATILTNCVAGGGRLERTTVPAGTFNTCHEIRDGQETYTSPEVTFAVVAQFIYANGIESQKTLTAFVKH